MKRKPKHIRAYAMACTATLVIASIAAAAIFNPTERVDKRHCPVDRPSPKTLVVALDTSDPLITAQPREIGDAVEQKLVALGKGDHIVVLDAAGRPPAEVVPVVDQCDAGDDDNSARNAFKNAVLGPIEAHLHDLKTQPASSESPLAETVLSIAADASLHSQNSQLVILFITDALQNTAFESAYRPGSNFPKLEGSPLKSVTVQLFLVKNERDFLLQPRAVHRFITWLTEAGAKVTYTAPAWLSLATAKRERGSK